jgi:hypothetical protein
MSNSLAGIQETGVVQYNSPVNKRYVLTQIHLVCFSDTD